MRVVLINPSSKIMDSSRVFRRFVSPIPPLGLSCLAAVLEKRGIEIHIIDQVGERITIEGVIKRVKELSPEIIGISCLTPAINNVKLLVTNIRNFNEKPHIILGNIHPTIFADELLKENTADVIVRGEGEISLLETVLAIKNNENLSNVRGISFRTNGDICHNLDRPIVEDIDTFPYPAWHLLDLTRYASTPLASVYEKVLPIQASRGCPYRCIFCSQDKIYKKPRYRQIKNIIDELEFMHKRYSVRYFGFFDPFFPFSVEHGLEFCEEVFRHNLHKKIKWSTETRVDRVNQKLLDTMKKAGCHLIMYGFEVGNQSVLDGLNKKMTLEQSRQAMDYTKKAGIHTLGLFMLGTPGETRETCEQTIRFAKELDCDIAKFNIVVPYPGSEFFEKSKVKIKKEEMNWERFIGWVDWTGILEPSYVPEAMNKQELINLQRKAMFQFYMRPKIILRHILRGTISLEDMVFGAYVLTVKYIRLVASEFNRNLKKWIRRKN